jgi:FtsP/CotA-like multicopper oxidase with cupredoxin domain
VLVPLSVLFYYNRLWFHNRMDIRQGGSAILHFNYILHPEKHICKPPTTIEVQLQVTTVTKRQMVSRSVYTLPMAGFPEQNIEARSGDTLRVKVQNNILDKGLSIHWHGLHMGESNDMYGAVGITQDAILSGEGFTYHFQIANHKAGTFWYHAHNGVVTSCR